MTWRTSKGERVLSAPEANLFASAIGTMIDFANDDVDKEGLNSGCPLVVGPFQQLSDARKYTVLEQVTRALLHPTPTCPELTATNESAICYVFHWLKEQFDIVEDGEYVWGQQVLDALPEEEVEVEEDGTSFLPHMGCLDLQKWDDALELLMDRILWDRDFEMEDRFTGGQPEVATYYMAFMRIDPGYFKPFTGAASRGAKERLYDLISTITG